jgi:Tol biopolymer transport system component
MPLAAGIRLGHYVITTPLGAGGMGEVYRAVDSRLAREVALKVLPDALAHDPDRMARFTREAQVLASLNHPHIATIYGIEESGAVRALAMELVEGPTLADRLRDGAIPWEDAAPLARQIAEALEAAHEKGIIHRDLKPSNIKITPEGEVKVIDFGLAKVADPAPKGGDPSESPTLTFRATQTGVILGTAAYMPPEQARGIAVDRRADIWSFGAVLYEMLAGKRAFSGETVSDVLAAVLKLEPDWSALQADTPEPLRLLLRRCLDKDRKRRLRDIGEARIVLETPLAEPAQVAPEVKTAAARRPWGALSAALVAGILIGGGIWWLLNRGQPATAILPEFAFRQLTHDAGLTTEPAISPDGKFVVYASDRGGRGDLDLWLQQVQAGGLPVRLTDDPADEHEASFSPDGSTIVFRSEKDGGGIYRMAAVGGEPRLIAKGGRNPRFSPDGAQIAYWTGGRLRGVPSHLFLVSASGGQPREVETGQFWNRFPLWTPDGRQLVFMAGLPPDLGVVTPGPPTAFHLLHGLIVQAPIVQVPVPAGWWRGLLLTGGGSIRGWKLAPGLRDAQGAPIRLTAGSALEDYPSASVAGMLAFASLTANMNVWTLPMDFASGKISGELRRLTRNADRQADPAISPDRRRFAYQTVLNGVLVREIDSGKEIVAVPGEINASTYPSFSPDGRRIAFNTYRVDTKAKRAYPGISVVEAGGGPAEQVCDDCGMAPTWSADSKKILYDTPMPRLIGLLDLEKKNHGALIQGEKHGVYQGSFSPDDRWVLFEVEYGADHAALALAPYQQGAKIEPAQWIELTDGKSFDSRPRWSPDGNRIYFVSDRDGFRCIWTLALAPATKKPAGPLTPLYHFHSAQRSILNIPAIAYFNLSVGRDQLLFNLGEVTGNIWLADPAQRNK